MTTNDSQITEWVASVIGSDTEVLYQILAHPDEAPTFDELYYFTPLDETTIDSEVSELIELGILREVGDEPFVGFTTRGKQFIVDSRVYRGSSVLKNVYQQTQMPSRIAEKFALERPESYLNEIIQPEFTERDWVRKTDDWKAGLDQQRVSTRLRVSESDSQDSVRIVFEREKATDSDEWVEILNENYSYSAEEKEVLGADRDPFEMESIDVEYVNNQSTPEFYHTEVTVYGLGSDIPSISVQIENEERSVQPVISAITEPTLTN